MMRKDHSKRTVINLTSIWKNSFKRQSNLKKLQRNKLKKRCLKIEKFGCFKIRFMKLIENEIEQMNS